MDTTTGSEHSAVGVLLGLFCQNLFEREVRGLLGGEVVHGHDADQAASVSVLALRRRHGELLPGPVHLKDTKLCV